MLYRYANVTSLVLRIAILLSAVVGGCEVEESRIEETESISQAISGVTCDVGRGDYCSGNGVSGWGIIPDTLYTCPGKGREASSAKFCNYGCKAMPAGTNDYCNPPPPTPVHMYSSDLDVFQNGNYKGDYLVWDDHPTNGTWGGKRLSATYRWVKPLGTINATQVAMGPATDKYSFVGECVSLVKSLSGRTAPTSEWRPGEKVMDAAWIADGTAIATFHGSSYRNDTTDHTGFFGGYVYDTSGNRIGFTMLDQNYHTDGRVNKHDITGASKDRYHILLVP